MTLISLRGIKKSFGDLEVLKGIDLDINEGDRVGLVGNNGAGKTTLANIISGSTQPDEGVILKHRQELSIGYLLQSTLYSVGKLNSIFEHQQDSAAMQSFLEVSGQLGLDKVKDWDLEKIKGLSGGEKTKLALAEVWISRPDLLILDEPTNHMDFKGVEWLIGELSRYRGTVMIVSHDRYFLDRTVNRIAELDNGTIGNFSGNYSFYRDEKKRRYQIQLHQHNVEKRQQHKIEEEIERWKNWSEKAHREAGKKNIISDGKQMGLKEFERKKAKKMDMQVKSRIKRLEKMKCEGTDRPREEQKILFDVKCAQKRGRRVIEARGISKAYGDRYLCKDSSFYIQRGEKIGLFGENGCGKTTLIKAILGTESIDTGELWVSPTVHTAYLSQDVNDMAEAQSALEYLGLQQCTRDGDAWTLLVNMGFNEAMLKRPVKTLSLGERTRIKLAHMILKGNDFILLDEPTNHLDLASREQLEETLADYTGTLLVVSHDRYLLERICDKLLVFKEGKIIRIEGGFKEYWENPESKSSGQGITKRSLEEEKMVIENRIASVLGELSAQGPGSPKYAELDDEFKRLVLRKRQLNGIRVQE